MGFWQVFHTLSRSRQWSTGMTVVPQAIEVQAIRAEARARYVDEDEAVEVVQELDEVWRAHKLQRLNPKPKKEKKPEK